MKFWLHQSIQQIIPAMNFDEQVNEEINYVRARKKSITNQFHVGNLKCSSICENL